MGCFFSKKAKKDLTEELISTNAQKTRITESDKLKIEIKGKLRKLDNQTKQVFFIFYFISMKLEWKNVKMI